MLLSAANTGMGMPPVVVGLIVWLLLTRSGPLGSLGLIYTKEAMVLAQFVIATPLIVVSPPHRSSRFPPSCLIFSMCWERVGFAACGSLRARLSSVSWRRSWQASVLSSPR